MLRVLFAVILLLPLPLYANESDTTTTTTTTVPDTTTTTIPGEVEEIETFDGPLEEELEEETTETTTTTTTIPEWEQSTDIELPEDELDIQGNEVENNIQIDDIHSNGNWFCCGMTDFHMNLHYQQHGNDSNDYTFTLPETTTVDEEELEIEIYEVGFRIGALNNDGTVEYTHTDETTQTNVLEGQDNSNVQTMFEDVVYNIYDTLDTFIQSFTITINDWSLLDDISFKYIMPTTTTTTTTTLPPPPPEPPKPSPPPPEPEMIVVVLDDGTEAEYQEHEIEDGTVERDNERKANEDKFGCYMTDAQIERGDCDIMEEDELHKEIPRGDTGDTETEFFEDDDMVLQMVDEDEDTNIEDEFVIETTKEDIIEKEIEINVKELEEEFSFDEKEFTFEDISEIIIIEEDEDIDDWDTEFEEELDTDEAEVLPEIIDEKVLDEPIQEDVVEEPIELTEEEVIVEVEEVENIVEDIIIEEVTTDEVIEVLEEVNDIGVQNLSQATEETQVVIQAVVEEAIEDVEELTEEQVEVVAEVLQVETEDVEIIAEAVKSDELVAEAVEEYVERAVENADVEDYTLADVVTEVQYEAFIENPLEVLIDLDNITDINLSNISNDMTQDQKEKAQEVVVPVILTRIASMAAFVFRRSL